MDKYSESKNISEIRELLLCVDLSTQSTFFGSIGSF